MGTFLNTIILSGASLTLSGFKQSTQIKAINLIIYSLT